MKRIVAWMLICILLIGLLSVVVCAADVDSPEGQVEIVTDPTVPSPQTGVSGSLLMAAVGMIGCLGAAVSAFRKSSVR